MAWTSPMTFVTGATLTAAQLNTYLKDNLNETAVAKATTAGSYFVGTGTNALAERILSYPAVLTSETTMNTSFDDLATVGPAATLVTSQRAMIALSAYIGNTTVNATSSMGVDITGAATVAATDTFAIRPTSSTANASIVCSYVGVITTGAGSCTFTAKYKVATGTGTFANRRLTVMPF